MSTSTGPDQRPRHFIGWRIAVLATIMIGLATLAISEPEFETRSAAPQQ